MTSKVLFLDFDGPLYPYRYIRHHPANIQKNHGKYLNNIKLDYWKMEELAVEMLLSLYAIYPFELVISSTWSRLYSKDDIRKLLLWNGIELPFHSNWTTPKEYRSERGREINSWLKDHSEIDDYIILDDHDSGSDLDMFGKSKILNEDRIVLVNPDMGISSYDYIKMNSIVNGWAGIKEVKNRPIWI